MNPNQFNQNPTNAPVPPSQTGSPVQPVQVENVQYNVPVQGFSSRVGLAFTVASASFIVLMYALAWALNGVAGKLFGFGYGLVGERFVLLIALAVPLVPLYLFSNKRLKAMVMNPAYSEEIVFKSHLRKALWGEIILAVGYIVYGLYMGLNVVFLKGYGNAAEYFSTAILFGGAFVIMGLWSYSYQKLTIR